MSEVIRAQELSFRYGTGGFGLRVPELVVRKGDRVGLVGPSGCGKSTLLRLIAGSLAARGGSLRVDGRELVGAPDAVRRRHRLTRIGLVFQDYPLVPHLHALQNVLLPYRIGGLRVDAAARQAAAELLQELELGAKLDRRPARLSQGERQRVALARALVLRPTLILADEPTTGLDAARTQGVLQLLGRLCAERGAALVLVSHDREVVAHLDREHDVSDWAEEAA